MTKERDIQFDIVRVLATLWIVGGWHALDYIQSPHVPELKPHLGFITTYVLATFMFMSGYFLSKYTFESRNNVIQFYKKRFIRFFPLFALSAITLFLMGGNPGKLQLLLTLTGLSSYLGHQPYTVWFISMLFSFYMITPFVSRGLQRIGNSTSLQVIAVIVCSACFIFLLSLTPLQYDVRLSYTMPFYGLGLVLGKTKIIKKITSKWYVFLTSFTLCFFFYRMGIRGDRYLQIDTVMGVILLLSVSYWFKYILWNKAIGVISFASMCMYLFHRQVYLILLHFVWHDDKTTWVFLYGVMLPVVIVVSYFIQKIYDKCVDYITEKKQ